MKIILAILSNGTLEFKPNIGNETNIVLNRNGSSFILDNNSTLILETSRRTMAEEQPFLFSTSNLTLFIGIFFALLSTVSAIGMLSVIVYRRYYWNKPQTFSDKCSNADSTGYIDDTTLKDNAEEMYSLDNDSFLNSLEAMTIQNYWVDSIRHTKL